MIHTADHSETHYSHCLTKARRAFRLHQRETACHWYAEAALHRRPDAVLQDLADFLVVATEYRPDLARKIARQMLERSEPLPPTHLQDIFCCALFLPDPELEELALKKVHSSRLTPHLCLRIADMYFDYAANRREQAKALLWVNRAAKAEPTDFNDWAAKTHALYVLVEDDEQAAELVLSCADKSIELASRASSIDPAALDDLLEAFDYLAIGPELAKALYDQVLLNENIPLPEKHRIRQDQKEILQEFDLYE